MSEGGEPGGGGPEPGIAAAGDVLRTPVRGGALAGTVVLALLVAGSAWNEGGVGVPSDRTRALAGAACLAVGACVTGFYGHRIALAALEGDREVRWGEDPLDRTTWMQDVAHFASVLLATFAPAVAAAMLARACGFRGAGLRIVSAVVLVAGAVHVPLSLVSTTLREKMFGASWRGTFRAFVRDRRAACVVAAWATAAFLMFGVSAVAADVLVPELGSGRPEQEHLPLRDLGRAVIFASRFAGIWAMLGSIRAAAVAARDREAMREVLE